MTFETIFYIVAIVGILANLVFLVVLTTLAIKVHAIIVEVREKLTKTLTMASLPFLPKIAAMPFKLIGRAFNIFKK